MWVTVAAIAGVSIFMAGLAVGAKIGIFGVGENLASFNSAKSVLDKSGMIPPTPDKIDTIGGIVKAVNAGKITLSVSRVIANPFANQGPVERTINISDKTIIAAKVPLSAEEMNAANKSFLADIQAGKAAAPPAPFKEVPAKLSDIKPGMTIAVTSNDDIRNAQTINAAKISFQGGIVVVPTPAPTKKK